METLDTLYTLKFRSFSGKFYSFKFKLHLRKKDQPRISVKKNPLPSLPSKETYEVEILNIDGLRNYQEKNIKKSLEYFLNIAMIPPENYFIRLEEPTIDLELLKEKMIDWSVRAIYYFKTGIGFEEIDPKFKTIDLMRIYSIRQVY